jgi:CRISPR-associated protein Csd2
MVSPNPLQRRHEFVLFFDVANGNPNGDPDAGNMPRTDPETGHGLVSDVCLKRKVRNYVEMAKADSPRYRIYVTEGAILNEKHREAYVQVRPADAEVQKAKKLSPKSDEEAARLREFMCANFYDIRAFGAVLSTGINAGQVRGPVQFSFGRSVEPVMPLEISVTRMAATNETEKKERLQGEDAQEKRGDNRTMGRKHIIPYGLYEAHGYISAPLGP